MENKFEFKKSIDKSIYYHYGNKNKIIIEGVFYSSFGYWYISYLINNEIVTLCEIRYHNEKDAIDDKNKFIEWLKRK